MITSVINETGAPVEIAPGRGDLRRGSAPFVLDLKRYLDLVDRHVSFAHIFASQPMIGAAVNWLMRQSRRVPLYTYRRVEGDSVMKLTPKEHPLADAIANPTERLSQVQLVNRLLGSYLVHGNSVAPVEQGARNKIQLMPADWRFSIPIMPWRGAISGWIIDSDQPGASEHPKGADTVLHIADYSPLGPFGISPLQQLGITIAIEDAAKRHQRSLLANGVRSPQAIKTSDDRFFSLDPAERATLMANFREDIDEIMAGPENAGRPWLLPPGLDVTPIGQNAQEAQLIEQRVVNRTEAIGIYGLTPASQGVIERGAELEQQRQAAVVEGLAPCLILIESCINAQIATGLLAEEDVFTQFDFTAILRGAMLHEIEALRNAVASALMTPNEGRDRLQLQRSNEPAMDSWYLPRNNLIPVDVPYKAKGMDGGGTEEDGESSDEGVPEGVSGNS